MYTNCINDRRFSARESESVKIDISLSLSLSLSFSLVDPSGWWRQAQKTTVYVTRIKTDKRLIFCTRSVTIVLHMIKRHSGAMTQRVARTSQCHDHPRMEQIIKVCVFVVLIIDRIPVDNNRKKNEKINVFVCIQDRLIISLKPGSSWHRDDSGTAVRNSDRKSEPAATVACKYIGSAVIVRYAVVYKSNPLSP
jgi:hypothetical protein